MNRSRPIRTGVSEKPNLRKTPPERIRVIEIFVIDGKVCCEQNDKHFQRIHHHHLPLTPSPHSHSIRMSSLPVSQLVRNYPHNLIIRQLLQQRIVDQNAVYPEKTVRGGVAVAGALTAVDHLQTTHAEAHRGGEREEPVAQRRALHRFHRVEEGQDPEGVDHVQRDGEEDDCTPHEEVGVGSRSLCEMGGRMRRGG